eukprot:2756919-Amphidinium_carterae.3
MLSEMVPNSDEEWLGMVAAASLSRNSAHNSQGFSPMQRVLGVAPRIAGELCTSGFPDAMLEGPLASMRRAAEIRHVASKAYLQQQHRDRLKTAMRTRHRVMPYDITPGMRVWTWRKPIHGRRAGWYGPGVVLAKTSSGAFVQVRGALWKVPEQHMRPQSEEDKLGWDLVNRFLHHLKHELAQDQPLRRRFVDCTRDGPPDDDHLSPEDLNIREDELPTAVGEESEPQQGTGVGESTLLPEVPEEEHFHSEASPPH